MKVVRTLSVVIAAALGLSCSRWDLPIEIPFHAAWHGKAIACSGTTPALTDLRFYVTNPRLVDEQGSEHDVRFATEWENDAVAYIDLENGEGACGDGSPALYDHIVGVARAGNYRGLRFTIGVPFRLNHADLRNASPPLNLDAMHTRSVSGYRFLRAGVADAQGDRQVYIGSAACKGSPGYVTDCELPNRIEVFLADFVPGKDGVAVNLDLLLAGTGADGYVADCTAVPMDAGCAAALAALGIDPETGHPTGEQRVFSVR